MFEAEEALLPSFSGSEAADLVSKVNDGQKAKVEEALTGLAPETLEEDKERIAQASWLCACKDLRYTSTTAAVPTFFVSDHNNFSHDGTGSYNQTAQYCIKIEAMKAMEDLVGLMGKLHLAPPAEVLTVLERALLLVGKARPELSDAR